MYEWGFMTKLDSLYKFEKFIIVSILSLMASLSMVQVILRYIFNIGWTWVTEILILGFINVSIAAASTGFKNGVHIGVTVLIKRFPYRFKKILAIFASICSIAIFTFMSILTILYIIDLYESGQNTVMTNIPLWMCISYLPLGFIFAAVHNIELLLLYLRKSAEEIEIEETKEHV